MKKIKITQVRSGIDKPARQKRTLIALGFKKMHQVIEVEANPQMLGMIEKVRHLITIEEID
jgi:large subunit ribosomal protein L30